ncbi:hypothetical protein GE061_014434 [Apolygus lucorum]|uniref:Uncharacterized protein n=1 Tax=Apolygus lucorum TaxID=248454 RepID=A0A8S9XQV8_APOLU|nr:hypothetical protein GE061_014434 [Apolygus lucorum]
MSAVGCSSVPRLTGGTSRSSVFGSLDRGIDTSRSFVPGDRNVPFLRSGISVWGDRHPGGTSRSSVSGCPYGGVDTPGGTSRSSVSGCPYGGVDTPGGTSCSSVSGCPNGEIDTPDGTSSSWHMSQYLGSSRVRLVPVPIRCLGKYSSKVIRGVSDGSTSFRGAEATATTREVLGRNVFVPSSKLRHRNTVSSLLPGGEGTPTRLRPR